MKRTFLLFSLLLLCASLAPSAAQASPPPYDPLRQPKPTSPYGMDLLGPSWQWTFPREKDYPRLDGALRVDQADEMLKKSWAAGVRSARIAAWWCFLEPEDDHYRWDDLDIMVQLSQNYGIEPVPEILYTPYWAVAEAPKPNNSCIDNWLRNRPPDDIADWEAFISDMVERYGANGKNQIHYWEIWNEPDLPEFLTIPGGGRVVIYAGLLKAASEAIRTEDPRARVMLGGLSDIKGPEFIGDLLDLDGEQSVREAFDIIPFHTFSAHKAKLDLITRPLAARDVSYELWINELNNTEWDNNYFEAAADLDRLFKLIYDYDVTRTFWFQAWTTKWGPGIFLEREPMWEPAPFLPSPLYEPFQAQTFPHQLPDAPGVLSPTANSLTSARPTFRWRRPQQGSYALAGYKVQVENTLYQGQLYFHTPEIDAFVPAGLVHFLPLQLQNGAAAARTADTSSPQSQPSVPLSISNPSFRSGVSLKPGRYFWRVAAVDVEGNVGPYSEPVLFQVTAGDERQFLPSIIQ